MSYKQGYDFVPPPVNPQGHQKCQGQKPAHRLAQRSLHESALISVRPCTPGQSDWDTWQCFDPSTTNSIDFVSALSPIIFIICSTPRSNASRKFNRLFFQFYSYYIFSNILHNFRLDVNFAFNSTPPKIVTSDLELGVSRSLASMIQKA